MHRKKLRIDRTGAKSIDIYITTNFSPINQSIKKLKKTMTSIKSLEQISGRKIDYKLWILVDGLNPKFDSDRNRKSRYRFLKRIYYLIEDSEYVFVNPTWGHLSGTLCEGIKNFGSSEVILVLQDDLEFCVDIPLLELIHVMDANREIQHLRFNKRKNDIAGLDTDLQEKTFSDFKLLKTNNWSDNNYLMSRKHFIEIIYPLIFNSQTFPENILRKENLLKPEVFGTYIYGEFGKESSIKHLGGIDGRIRGRLEMLPSKYWNPLVIFIVKTMVLTKFGFDLFNNFVKLLPKKCFSQLDR